MEQTNKKTKVIVLIAVAAMVVIVLGYASLYIVNEGRYAAVYTLGKLDRLESEAGLHFKIPFLQNVKNIDVREQSIEITQNAYTKDTQTVEKLVVKINYRLDTNRIDEVIRQIGVDQVYSTIVEPNVYAVTRNTIGQYTADALIGHRTEITQSIQDELIRRYEGKGIVLMAFTIQDIDFEDSFEAAVRRKVEAEQKALEAQNQTKESEEIAKQQVISAQGKADATKVNADADAYAIKAKASAEAYAMELLNKQLAVNPSYIDYLKVTKWDGILPTVQGGTTSSILDMRDLTQ